MQRVSVKKSLRKGDGEKSQELDCNRSYGECKCETFGLYTEVKEVRQLLQSSVKQGGGSILVQGCISASGVGSCQG